jgi:hypothetical protein
MGNFGKGMSKPSFLIGTMHVSSKLAFHLPDSFYYAIRNANVVALKPIPKPGRRIWINMIFQVIVIIIMMEQQLR